MRRQRSSLHVGCVAILAIAAGAAASIRPAYGQDGTKWLVIISGHPGDQEHRDLFAYSIRRIRMSLTERFGFDEENTWVWFGADETDDTLEPCRGPATREALATESGGDHRYVPPLATAGSK